MSGAFTHFVAFFLSYRLFEICHRFDKVLHHCNAFKFHSILKSSVCRVGSTVSTYFRHSFYRDWDKARHYYEKCTQDDPERADPFFYIGQYYRLRQQHKNALPWLKKAAILPIPNRSLFQWHYLYNCLGHLELGRAVLGLGATELSHAELSEYKSIIADGDCREGASMGDSAEIKQIVGSLDVRLDSLSGASGTGTVVR
jgi:hypothetical protein